MAIETIMLNTPDPTGTPVFSMGPSVGASYDGSHFCWRITVPGGGMNFNLNLSGYDLPNLGVTLMLVLSSADYPGETYGPLNVKVNGSPVVSDWDSQEDTFYQISWAIPPALYSDNLAIGLSLGSAADTSVSVREVTCLVFQMQKQQQELWCWLAAATSVSLFYNSSSPWTQCLLANQQLNQATCCPPGSNPACNQTGPLNQALTATGNFASMQADTVAASSIQEQSNANQPVGIRIAWPGGGAHIIVASGVSQDLVWILVEDPIDGTSCITWETLVSGYQGVGTWTNTYFTAA